MILQVCFQPLQLSEKKTSPNQTKQVSDFDIRFFFFGILEGWAPRTGVHVSSFANHGDRFRSPKNRLVGPFLNGHCYMAYEWGLLLLSRDNGVYP